MAEVASVFILSFAMFFGCYLAGYIPLTISVSEGKLRAITTMGAGLLIGTALSVIIPEGVQLLYNSNHQCDHSDAVISHVLDGNPINVHPDSPLNGEVIDNPLFINRELNGIEDVKSQSNEAHSVEAHTYLGLALVLGFILMLLVDQFSGGKVHGHQHNKDSAITSQPNKSSGLTATIGLTVHAAVDGIALGAASATSRTDVEIIVFVAIMLHKAPAAFGLVSFLIHDGLEKYMVRRHLLIFSLAAPTLAIITFVFLSSSSSTTLKTSTEINTGLAMLFSAGTFLYVSTVHILPELLANSGGGFGKLDLSMLVIGIFIPSLLALGHTH